jgi:hypothetical protein
MNHEVTGEVVDVESQEAEHTLNILESLFDFCFVAPEVTRRKRQAIKNKSNEAKKPQLIPSTNPKT